MKIWCRASLAGLVPPLQHSTTSCAEYTKSERRAGRVVCAQRVVCFRRYAVSALASVIQCGAVRCPCSAYNDTPSKAPKISLRLPIAAQQQQPAAPAQHLQDDEGLQQLEGLDQQPDWLPQQEAGLAVVPFALPGDNIDMIAAMRAELQALKQQVLDLERRLILVEFGI